MVENFLRVFGREYGADRHNEDKKENHDHNMNVGGLKVQERRGEGCVSIDNFRRFPLPTFVDISRSEFRREPISYGLVVRKVKTLTRFGRHIRTSSTQLSSHFFYSRQ